MRSLVYALLGLTAATASAQSGTEWRLGATLGLGSPNGMVGMVDGNSRGSGGLFAEIREPGRRLGFRVEFAQRGELSSAAFGANRLCDGCYSRTDRLDRALLLTMNWEFRQGRRFQPYALFGMGVSRTVDTEHTNVSCSAGGSCAARQDFAYLTPVARGQAAMTLGAGASWSIGRVAPFVEGRLGSAAEVFNLGFRITPF